MFTLWPAGSDLTTDVTDQRSAAKTAGDGRDRGNERDNGLWPRKRRITALRGSCARSHLWETGGSKVLAVRTETSRVLLEISFCTQLELIDCVKDSDRFPVSVRDHLIPKVYFYLSIWWNLPVINQRFNQALKMSVILTCLRVRFILFTIMLFMSNSCLIVSVPKPLAVYVSIGCHGYIYI